MEGVWAAYYVFNFNFCFYFSFGHKVFYKVNYFGAGFPIYYLVGYSMHFDSVIGL